MTAGNVERHEVHEGEPPAVCVGQWCCGCDEHPIGKPWGWNHEAWERHYAEAHPERFAGDDAHADGN